MFYQISPQVKRCAIITYSIYQLLHELPHDLRFIYELPYELPHELSLSVLGN